MAFLSLAEVIRLEVWAVRPELLSKLTQLMERAHHELGLRTMVREYGGYRGPGIQALLLQWRNQADAKDGIIGGGRDYYAVAPAGKSHHEWGAAVDLAIVQPELRTDANYRKLALLSKDLGLVPGYFFSKKDEFHHQLAENLETAAARWRSMMKKRAAVVTVAVLILAVFFFPASSALA